MKIQETLESQLLRKSGEIFGAGLFEDKNASFSARFARAFKRYFEYALPAPYEGGLLYPETDKSVWALVPGQKINYNYSFSLSVNINALTEICEKITDGLEKDIFRRVIDELNLISAINIPQKYRIGGGGYTHSIINYKRILKEGLECYLERINARLSEHLNNKEKTDFYEAVKETLESIIFFHGKCISELKKQLKKTPDKKLEKLINAFEKVPLKKASSFYEAMLSFNFMYYIDGCDSIGRFDQYMFDYFSYDMENKIITTEEVEELLEALWRNVDAQNGWHMILGGKNAYNELTYLCIKTQQRYRRPNTGIRICDSMPERFWGIIFDSWQNGSPNPSLYNEKAYLENIPFRESSNSTDMNDFAFGGCTELMVDGLSNIGSIDAGINLLDVLDNTIKLNVETSASFEDFMSVFKSDITRNIKTAINASNMNQRHMALYRPQLVRSLFIDDCIEKSVEFNAGGARYNGSVINVAGMSNVFNSLFTLRKLFNGELALTKADFIKMLNQNYQGYEKEFRQIMKFRKFGNRSEEVDSIASELSEFIFSEINSYRSWRGDGPCIPGVIMFVTYAPLGAYIGATPDGRISGSPIADSVGAMQGTDMDGPTSLLASSMRIAQKKGMGTLVMNLRLDYKIFESHEHRERLKSLILTYFENGGLQLQVTVADKATLKKAMMAPQQYPNLMVRIGGYSEYYNRLSDVLKEELMKRTEHEF